MNKILLAIVLVLNFPSCQSRAAHDMNDKQLSQEAVKDTGDILRVGAGQFDQYIEKIKGKQVGLLINHTSVVEGEHLLDILISKNINVVKIFSPEHGFRGTAANGERVDSSIDKKTGIPIISLYGKNKKPTLEQIADIDIIIFDIQDVGTRFYTYISTMHYMMDACAQGEKEMLILDRPNPNGMYIDGPMRDEGFVSNVGLHPIPIVHGLTVAELAQMINGEGWLRDGNRCKITVVPIENYSHKMAYPLPLRPSPNLPNDQSIMLYPSLCLFEGTVLSVGRGTPYPFQLIGHPDYDGGNFTFTPKTLAGTMSPKLVGEKCNGKLLVDEPTLNKINLDWLLDSYAQFKKMDMPFFNNYFNKLAGTDQLRKQIESGKSEKEIRATWQPGLNQYKQMRKKYLLYEDFE